MFKDKQHMLNEILCLMDKVREHLKHDSNIDNFIDNDDEIDKWAKIIPKSQYPIFIISVFLPRLFKCLINSLSFLLKFFQSFFSL